MKKLLLMVLGITALQFTFAQIASNDTSIYLANEVNSDYIAAAEVEPVEAEVEPFVFVPHDNTVEIACKPKSFTDQGYIKLSSKKPNDVSLEFFDARGAKIKIVHFITREGIRLYQGDLEAGQYYYNILRDRKHVGYGKFTIQ